MSTPKYGGGMKSNASDYLQVATAIYKDACSKCTADVSDFRDLEVIETRTKHEGLSFLTITLPNFCKDFERSLAIGYIDSTFFRSFSKSGSIPAFLQGMISHVFSRETGRLNHEHTPDVLSGGVSSDIPTIVESVRQICLTFKKLEIDCAPKRVTATLESFIEVEASFEPLSIPDEQYYDFCDIAHMLWDDMVRPFRINQIVPRHGPGATAEKISGNSKFKWRRWHDRLEPYFPLVDTAFPLGTPVDAKELKLTTIVPETEEQPVRVTPVPKTLKGPRIIAIEPACMQYAQQGIRDWLYARLETYRYSRGHINFSDQRVNQRLAISSSRTGRLATIDLSDASDRVPRDLALEMFRANPDLLGAIEACRSTRAEMPDGRVIGPLNKFASMGSALCFPVEAMYFYTVCVVALLRAQGLPGTEKNILNVSSQVYVYGDDIIVPSTYAVIVLEYLQKYNCKVNLNKTFLTGKFRESCGVDAYDGKLVSPTYLRRVRPENKRQASQIISWVSTANLFYLRGYWRTAQLLYDVVEKIIGNLPYVSENSEGLGRISFMDEFTTGMWNNKMGLLRYHPMKHRFEVRTMVPRPVFRKDPLSGYAALQKSLASLSRQADEWAVRDASHLEHFALHGAVALKRRWVPAT
jgi:hypothetical protein